MMISARALRTRRGAMVDWALARMVRMRVSVNGRSRLLAGMAAAREAELFLPAAQRAGEVEDLGAADRGRVEASGDPRALAKADLSKLMTDEAMSEEGGARGFWAWVDLAEGEWGGRAWTPSGLRVEEAGAPHESPMAWALRSNEELSELRAQCLAARERESLGEAAEAGKSEEAGRRL